jgi:hypothetical protein
VACPATPRTRGQSSHHSDSGGPASKPTTRCMARDNTPTQSADGHNTDARNSRCSSPTALRMTDNGALRRLGPEGRRATEMLAAAAEQIERSGVRAGNLIAFCTREALMSLLDLGGRRKRNTDDAAREVVEIARRMRDQRASTETLLDATQKLEAALEGPGPHSERFGSSPVRAAGISPTVRHTCCSLSRAPSGYASRTQWCGSSRHTRRTRGSCTRSPDISKSSRRTSTQREP